jgi:hypothetical protein
MRARAQTFGSCVGLTTKVVCSVVPSSVSVTLLGRHTCVVVGHGPISQQQAMQP